METNNKSTEPDFDDVKHLNADGNASTEGKILKKYLSMC